MLSHDLELGGPALALYHAAGVLRKYGYDVVFASMIDGTLGKRLVKDSIPLVVDVNLQIETMADVKWIKIST